MKGHSEPEEMLKSYNSNDYSPSFQKLMSRVVGKIYNAKTYRSLEMQKNHRFSLSSDKLYPARQSSLVISSKRKSSMIATRYFSTGGEDSLAPNSKIDKLNFFRTKGNFKNLPSLSNAGIKSSIDKQVPSCVNSIQLYERISEYNQCLITKSYQNNENSIQFSNKQSERHILQRIKPSKIKKNEQSKKYNSLVRSRNYMKQQQISHQQVRQKPIHRRPSECNPQPWETDQPTQLFF